MSNYLTGYKRHLEILKGLAPASVDGYCRIIGKFTAWLDGQDKDVEKVTGKDVEAHLEQCFYRGNKNVTRLTKLIALQGFFRYLLYEGVIETDPTANIPRPRIRQKFVQKFTKAETLRLFEQLDITTEKGLRDTAIIILGAFCGMRVSEMVNLNLNDIVFLENGTLDINIIDSKHRGSRTVYLWKAPSALVSQYITTRLSAHQAKGSDPLLPSYKNNGQPIGNRLNKYSVYVFLKKLAKSAGIRKPEIHPHMLRASHINDLRSIKGYDLPAIAERVGHKHISTTDRYIPRRERIHRTYNSLHEYWREAMNLWHQQTGGDKNQ